MEKIILLCDICKGHKHIKKNKHLQILSYNKCIDKKLMCYIKHKEIDICDNCMEKIYNGGVLYFNEQLLEYWIKYDEKIN